MPEQNEQGSVMDKISNTLTTLLTDADVPMQGVWYGACNAESLTKWNYFVFNRAPSQWAPNGCDLEHYYDVHIIHEDYIPEGYVEKVIAALVDRTTDRTKLKPTGDDISYEYTFKGNTNMVVEIATIRFVHPMKRM